MNIHTHTVNAQAYSNKDLKTTEISTLIEQNTQTHTNTSYVPTCSNIRCTKYKHIYTHTEKDTCIHVHIMYKNRHIFKKPNRHTWVDADIHTVHIQ